MVFEDGYYDPEAARALAYARNGEYAKLEALAAEADARYMRQIEAAVKEAAYEPTGPAKGGLLF